MASKVLSETKSNNFYIPLTYVSLGLLTLGVLTSKEILVFNAESLVAISFTIFMVFAYRNVSDVIVTELEDRSERIRKEFDHYFSLREDLLSLLISYHSTRKMLSDEVTNISHFSKNEIKHILAKRQKALKNNLSVQVQQKLKTILLKELSIIQQVQQETSHWFAKHVLASFATKNPSVTRLKDIMIKEAIDMINVMSKYSSIQGKELDLNDDTKVFLHNILLLNRTTHIPINNLLMNYVVASSGK